MKYCSTCDTTKELSEFSKDRARKDGLNFSCRACRREREKHRYEVKYKEKRKKGQNARAAIASEYIKSVKQKGCELCPETVSACLEFHHLDPSQKDFVISGSRNKNLDKIKAEIEKCAVLCANCHRKVHLGILKL